MKVKAQGSGLVPHLSGRTDCCDGRSASDEPGVTICEATDVIAVASRQSARMKSAPTSAKTTAHCKMNIGHSPDIAVCLPPFRAPLCVVQEFSGCGELTE